MVEAHQQEADTTPTLEVRVFRNGDVAHRELCESEEQAAIVIEAWAEVDGTTCEVRGLSNSEIDADATELDFATPPHDYATDADGTLSTTYEC
jgi:hypothetical protein